MQYSCTHRPPLRRYTQRLGSALRILGRFAIVSVLAQCSTTAFLTPAFVAPPPPPTKKSLLFPADVIQKTGNPVVCDFTAIDMERESCCLSSWMSTNSLEQVTTKLVSPEGTYNLRDIITLEGASDIHPLLGCLV
jgi:hypothetical protein